MRDKLKWNAIGLVKKTQTLLEYIQEELNQIPIEHSNKCAKLQRYLDELHHLQERMEKIEKILIPKLERLFHLEFPTPELVMFALSRPSMRNIFEDLGTLLKNDEDSPLKQQEFSELASSGDAANVLALIGDAALSLAIVQVLWEPSMSNAGVITTKRSEVVSNYNQAKYCDEWGLLSCRLNRSKIISEEDTKPENIIHEKGTLVESILGVIYLEFGFKKLQDIVPLLQ